MQKNKLYYFETPWGQNIRRGVIFGQSNDMMDKLEGLLIADNLREYSLEPDKSKVVLKIEYHFEMTEENINEFYRTQSNWYNFGVQSNVKDKIEKILKSQKETMIKES